MIYSNLLPEIFWLSAGDILDILESTAVPGDRHNILESTGKKIVDYVCSELYLLFQNDGKSIS